MNAPPEHRDFTPQDCTPAGISLISCAPVIAGYACIEYEIKVAGEMLRLLGPASPDALLDRDDVRRRFELDEHLPYWSTPWPAAVMLAGCVIDDGFAMDGAILELGAGLGLAAIALARTDRQVVATDCDADALTFIRENARRNGVELAGIEMLDWRNPPPKLFDTIVAADVLYERRHVEPVASLIARMLTANGRAFICDVNRQSAVGFADVLRTHGLTSEQLAARTPAIAAMPGTQPRMIDGVIYRIRWIEKA